MAALLLGIALGLWLMASPAVLDYAGIGRIGALVAGPIAASVGWIALGGHPASAPVQRSGRRVAAGNTIPVPAATIRSDQ